jgi:hypothetical protein
MQYHNHTLPIRQDVEVFTPFYSHMYGGFARDIYVSREGFARFFSTSPEYVDTLPVNSKVFDDMQPGHEMLGYKIKNSYKNSPCRYRITFIDYGMRMN